MLTFETALRLLVIGQELLIAAVFLFGRGGRAARVSGAMLMLSIIAYLVASDAVLRSSLPLLEPLIALLALAVPFALWLFARALFEAPWPRPSSLVAAAAAGLSVWVIYLARESLDPGLVAAAGIVIRALSLLIVAHALWLTLRGRPDDLIEKRRSFRLFFVGIVSLQVAAVLIVELVLAGAPAPAWLDLTNVIVIAVLTLGLAIPMLRLDAEFFAAGQGTRPSRAPVPAEARPATGDGDRRKLDDLMQAGYFRKTGLTITRLASELGCPEHQLRRLINGHLGYRNFSAFLNGYRIDAAKRDLADPDQARTPVLTIALDLGYASIGPFNRAFKAMTGMTPTQFRHQSLGKGADSE